MRLYIIPAWYPQNVEDVTACFFREQAHALAARGHQVTVIHISPVSFTNAFHGKWHERRLWQDGDVRTFFHKVTIPIPGKFSKLQDWYISRCFTQIIRAQIQADSAEGFSSPDLLHAHVSHSCAYYCLDAAKKLNLPLVVTEHYSGLLLGTASKNDYSRVRRTILGANAFLFVGSNFQKSVCRRLDVDKKTYVVPNMIDTRLFPNITAEEKGRAFTFLTACHLKANKNVASVIQAFHEAFPEDDERRLVVAGDGDEMNDLKKLTQELHEEKRIAFYGRYTREELPNLFGNADAFVLVSQVETFGIVYLEAMMCGLPCIGTSGQGAEDIINETNGLKVPFGDLEALKSALRQIFDHRRTYDEKVIREECIHHFSSRAVCEEIEKIYQAVLQ